MSESFLERALYEGFKIRLLFPDFKPTFGDLFLIRGFAHPRFPPTNRFNFAALAHLEFDQVGDYFGITDYEGESSDVKVWLFPIVGGQRVYHHSGPFDGIELSYDVLRNPPQNAQLFLEVVAEFARHLCVPMTYVLRNQELGTAPDRSTVRNDLESVIAYWRVQGIEPGSAGAMMVSF